MSESGTPPRPQPAEAVEQEAEDRLDELEDAETDEPEEPPDPQPEDLGDEPAAGEEPEPEEPPEVDLADVDIGEEVDEDSPFDGVEHGRGDTSDSGGAWDGTAAAGDRRDETEDAIDAAEEMVEGDIENIVNEGAAQLSVMGLPDEFEHNGRTMTKKDLREEFEETFETFRLGKYSEETVEKYLDFEGEDIDPALGLAISMLICSVIVVQARPDGDEVLRKARNRVRSVK